MIKSLGQQLDPRDFLRITLGNQHAFVIIQNSDLSRPLIVTWPVLLSIIKSNIDAGTGTSFSVNDEGIVIQNDPTFLNFTGAGVTVTQSTTGVQINIPGGGSSFITSISDTADIDLDVTASDLSATLTTTGVTANTYGTATQVPQITVDSKGRITGVTLVNITAGSGTVTSVDLTMPSAFAVTGNPITVSGTLAVTGAGTTSQYVRGDGSLATYNPGTGGGGASVSYYLNGSVAQGTFGGVAFKQMSKTPVIGAGTDFTINANGYIQSFITDASTPNQLLIPAGNWNFEMYFSASSGGGSPSFYVELYKWDGATLTLIASSSATPEGITNGTAIDLYVTALAVPQTILAVTDRLAVRVYVFHSSKTIKLHTEDSHLCQVITTFTTGITALNGLTDQVQNFAVGTSGTNFTINSTTATHTFNIPDSSALNRGLLLAADWTTFNGKQDALTATKSVEIVSNNVELDGDETSPTARKFYSTSSLAARGWRAIEKADLPTVIQGATYPYVEKEFTSSNGGSAIIKIPGSDVIFVAYNTTSTVVAYNTLTSEILSTTSLLLASGLVYVAATGHVWAFSSAASITRFVATTGVSLGATPVLLLTASCRGIYDDSLVTGNVYAYNGTTMNVINHSTYVRLGVSIGGGTLSFELTLVTSGPQAGLLVGCVNIGIFGFNKATNTLAYGPGLPAAYSFIKFVPSLGVFIAGSTTTNIVSFITPTTATTLTLGSSVRGIQAPYQFEFDETENRLFIPSTATGTAQVRIAVVELTTLTWIKSVLITAVSANSNVWLTSDKANKALYVVGVNLGGSVNKVIYA